MILQKISKSLLALALLSGTLHAEPSTETIRRGDQLLKDYYLVFRQQLDSQAKMGLADLHRTLDQNLANNTLRIKESGRPNADRLAAQYFDFTSKRIAQLKTKNYVSSVIASEEKDLANVMLSDNYIFGICAAVNKDTTLSPGAKFGWLAVALPFDLILLPTSVLFTILTEIFEDRPRACEINDPKACQQK